MAVTEQARHRLYTYLEETMGDERAATMMELLPPVGYADLATKADIEQLRHIEIAALRNDIRRLEEKTVTKAEFERALHKHTVTTITMTSVIVGVAVTLTRLL